MEPGVDVVVVNYRTPCDLGDFLASFYAWEPATPHSLTVVNVEPTPEDKQVAAGWTDTHPGASLVSFDVNVGYARACNRGALRGGREVVALFNADVRLAPAAVDECYEALVSEPMWGVLGPRQVDLEGRLTHAGILGTSDRPRHRGWHHNDVGQFADIRDDAVTVSGSAYFAKRELWRHLTACPRFAASCDPAPEGAFLPTPHYYEETYASYHARAHGYRAVYYGPTTIVHRWHRASPVGGWAEQQFKVSQGIFRRACDAHGMTHD